jgi:hypothetical protein
MSHQENLDELRNAIHDADGEGTRTELILRLARNPDSLWKDLLDSLKYPVIGQLLAFRLHDMLDIEIPDGGAITNKSIWENTLESKNIDINSRHILRDL